MSTWQLGVDFGTSFTVVAVASEGAVTVVDVESNGRSRMPSSVFLSTDGEILVGTAAQHQAMFSPERYEPTPKRSLGEGELFLGDRLVPVTDLAAAVLRRVYTEASRQQGETAPSATYITHPADWSETRMGVLREAIEQAGLPAYTLVAEPVAAAARIGLTTTRPGEFVAVYDFGGGTFDAAVLRRTEVGFDVAGLPAGRDPLGGEDIDQRIIAHLGEVIAGDDPDKWAQLMAAADVAWRRNAAGLRSEVQRAKETLSEVSVCQLWVPGLERDVQLTRSELEGLIAPDIEATVDTLEQVIADAGIRVGDLSGVYLVGGSSRIPLVADTIWRRLELRPAVQDNPKSVVAMGAAGWATLAEQAHRTPVEPLASVPLVPGDAGSGAEVPVGGPEPTRSGGSVHPFVGFRSVLAASVGIDACPDGCQCVAELTIDYQGGPPATVRARDEPATGTVEQLAAQVGGVRASRTPGFRETWMTPGAVLGSEGIERRFLMDSPTGPVSMFELYQVIGDRAYVIAGPEWARSVADSVALRPPTLDRNHWFEPCFTMQDLAGWRVSERLRIRRNGSQHALVAEREQVGRDVFAGTWADQHINALVAQHRGSKVVGRTRAPVLNQFEGELVTTSWADRKTPMVTKRGMALVDGSAYVVTISLPFDEQSMFAPLARQARIHPEVVAPVT